MGPAGTRNSYSCKFETVLKSPVVSYRGKSYNRTVVSHHADVTNEDTMINDQRSSSLLRETAESRSPPEC